MRSNPPSDSGSYYFDSPTAAHTHAYLLPTVLAELAREAWGERPKRVFDLGCGNGATAEVLATAGYDVTGVDPSEAGIRVANQAYPRLNLVAGSCYDNLVAAHGRFQAVVSLEVVEHVFLPRKFAACVFDLLLPGGVAVISTPYHGYLKNLVLALTGKLDSHFTALWDYGHIKFWSRRTLGVLFAEAGFDVLRFHRVGRIPLLAKSMVLVARRPV